MYLHLMIGLLFRAMKLTTEPYSHYLIVDYLYGEKEDNRIESLGCRDGGNNFADGIKRNTKNQKSAALGEIIRERSDDVMNENEIFPALTFPPQKIPTTNTTPTSPPPPLQTMRPPPLPQQTDFQNPTTPTTPPKTSLK